MKTFEKVRMTKTPKINTRPSSKSKTPDLLRDDFGVIFPTSKKSAK